MGVLTKFYDKETRTDKVWYNSSNIYYSEFVENENDNSGQLYVVFKNGSKYQYKDVDMPTDYLIFKKGGLDGSNGKALNAYIKPKYDFVKMEPVDIDLLEEERKRIEGLLEDTKKEDKKEDVYFISGHRDVTEEEFSLNYEPVIDAVLNKNPNSLFVIGDYYGVDIMAQNYLLDTLEIQPEHVFVYHMFDKPRNANPKVVNFCKGFQSDEERDAAMTAASTDDIAFVRDHTKLSGTAQNILRRYRFLTKNDK